VHDEGLHKPRRLIDTPAMAGEIHLFGAFQQRFKRTYIVTHVAFRRRDDGRVPPHHMITRKQRLSVIQRKAQMIGRVTGRVERFQRPIASRDPLPTPQCPIRREIRVQKGFARRIVLDGPPRRRLGSKAQNFRPRDLGEFREACGMILMGVGQENVGHALSAAAELRKQGGSMRLLVRPWIDDRDRAGADDIAVGALEGEWAGIVRDDTPEAGRDGFGHAVFALEIA